MCDSVNVNGHRFLICGVRDGVRYCKCGRPGKFLCDWKVAERSSGTCDRAICERCTLEVAPLKHLCPEHQVAYQSWQRRHPGIVGPAKVEQLGLFSEAT
jgi:hypothetical protein